MLNVLTIASFAYLVFWAITSRVFLARIQKANFKRATLKNGRFHFHPSSPEGKAITTMIVGTFLFVGAAFTLGICLIIHLIAG